MCLKGKKEIQPSNQNVDGSQDALDQFAEIDPIPKKWRWWKILWLSGWWWFRYIKFKSLGGASSSNSNHPAGVQTHSAANIQNECHFSTFILMVEPTYIEEALEHFNWIVVMQEELS